MIPNGCRDVSLTRRCGLDRGLTSRAVVSQTGVHDGTEPAQARRPGWPVACHTARPFGIMGCPPLAGHAGLLEVERDAAVGREPVEDRFRQRGDARFRGVAGRVVEGQLAVVVSGDQDQVAAGGRGFAVGAADLLVHRCHDEPAVAEFALDPAGAEAGDDVGLELVAVAGEVAELPVEQAGDPPEMTTPASPEGRPGRRGWCAAVRRRSCPARRAA